MYTDLTIKEDENNVGKIKSRFRYLFGFLHDIE